MNQLNDQLEDFASIPVPKNIRYSGLSIAMVTAVMVFGASSLSLGAQIGLSLGLRDSMIAFLLGGFFLSILAYIVGVIGVRSRLSSYVLIKIIFGKNGAILLNISLAIALLGWYGVSMDIFSASLNQLMRSILDINIPNYLIEITGGFLMTYSAIKGFKLLESLSIWITPLLIILTASLGYKAFAIWGQGLSQEILSAKPMTISMAADAVIGAFILGAILMSDYSRFARTTKDVATASFLPYFLLSTLAYTVAFFAAVVTNETDIIRIMTALGFGLAAVFLIFLSSWIVNGINLYSATLSLSTIYMKAKQWQMALLTGTLATIAALINILEQLTSFLILLTAIFTPVGGILIADYYLLRRKKDYSIDELRYASSFNYRAIVSCIIAVSFSFLPINNTQLTFGFPALDSLLIAGFLYYMITVLVNRIKER